MRAIMLVRTSINRQLVNSRVPDVVRRRDRVPVDGGTCSLGKRNRPYCFSLSLAEATKRAALPGRAPRCKIFPRSVLDRDVECQGARQEAQRKLMRLLAAAHPKEVPVKVADILAVKGSAVVTIGPSETIGALSERLREKRIGAAVVSTDGQAIDGVITERDITYGLAVHKGDLHSLPVSALMTRTVITCSPDHDVSYVAATMRARNIRHLPVEEDKRFVGMISIRDVLNFRVDDLQRQSNLLRAFASETDRDRPTDR
jgi:CBS domain-containing protein